MATWKQMTGETIKESFLRFDESNPDVYEMFKKYAFYLFGRGIKKTSGYMIVERVRWEVHVKTVGNDYKINNNFRPHYVRKFIAEFPEYADRFEIRKLRDEIIEEYE